MNAFFKALLSELKIAFWDQAVAVLALITMAVVMLQWVQAAVFFDLPWRPVLIKGLASGLGLFVLVLAVAAWWIAFYVKSYEWGQRTLWRAFMDGVLDGQGGKPVDKVTLFLAACFAVAAGALPVFYYYGWPWR